MPEQTQEQAKQGEEKNDNQENHTMMPGNKCLPETVNRHLSNTDMQQQKL